MIRKITFIVIIIISQSGCWDSIELDKSTMVTGVGLGLEEDKIVFSIETLTPTSEASSLKETGGSHIVLSKNVDTLLEGSRELIRITKRRVFFSHAQAWIIQDELASKQNLSLLLDVLKREQMLRLNSYIFITGGKPADILNSSPLYNNVSSVELVSGLEQIQFTSDYPAVKARQLFKWLMGPTGNGFLPIVETVNQGGKTLTEITGTAILKDGKLVGTLSPHESSGFLWLVQEAKGGYITLKLNQGKSSVEIYQGKTDINPTLEGENLSVNVNIKVNATLSGQILTIDEPIDQWMIKIGNMASQNIKQHVEAALTKLQKEFKTDATSIGVETYRRQPQAFRKVQDRWDEIFSNAKINVKAHVAMKRKGLSEYPEKPLKQKPENNPYTGGRSN